MSIAARLSDHDGKIRPELLIAAAARGSDDLLDLWIF